MEISPEVLAYCESRGFAVDLDRLPLWRTPEPGQLDDSCVFSFSAVDKVIKAFAQVRHTQGKLSGQRFKPAAWQVAHILAPVFGWLRENQDGQMVRAVRNAYVEMPRKNGKSTFAGAVALYLCGADGEPGAQVVTAAASESQAAFVFSPIATLARVSPDLSPFFHVRTKDVTHLPTGSTIKVVTSAANTLHGANISGAIIDELHVHKTRDLVDVIESGTGSRDQPLVLTITTADEDVSGSIYDEKHKYIKSLALKENEDISTYGVIYGTPSGQNALDPATWPLSNPNYPISPTHDFLASEANKAKQLPALAARFRRLYGGQRTSEAVQYFSGPLWDNNCGPTRVDESLLEGRPCVGGLDLAAVHDLTALCWLFPGFGPAGEVPGSPETAPLTAIWRMWLPEQSLPDLDRRTAGAASVWARSGWLRLTPGSVADYDIIRDQIFKDMSTFRVASLALDQWNSSQLSQQLESQGVPLVRVGQGYKVMSPALADLQRRLLAGEPDTPMLYHGGNPLLRWQIENMIVQEDAQGNQRPSRRSSQEKIDGVVAMLMALSELKAMSSRVSAYDSPLSIAQPASHGIMMV